MANKENNLKGWLYLLPAILFLGFFMVMFFFGLFFYFVILVVNVLEGFASILKSCSISIKLSFKSGFRKI